MSGYEAQPHETIKIKTEHFECRFLIINASDFDEETMELYEETPEAEAAVAPRRKAGKK